MISVFRHWLSAIPEKAWKQIAFEAGIRLWLIRVPMDVRHGSSRAIFMDSTNSTCFMVKDASHTEDDFGSSLPKGDFRPKDDDLSKDVELCC
jgi:hypothetical protein